MGGKRTALSDFMINAKIPQHIRDYLPLVVSPEHIIWVTGWRVDERVKITGQTAQVLHLRFIQAVQAQRGSASADGRKRMGSFGERSKAGAPQGLATTTSAVPA